MNQDRNRLRSERKREHVHHFLDGQFDGDPLLDDVYIYHNALVELDYDSVDFSTEFLSKKVSFPLMINAMTGGYDQALKINGDLAEIAHHLNIPMAVGSQAIALSDDKYSDSFKIVRKRHPNGVVVGNVNAFVTTEQAKKAVDMLEADGLQIHLNPAQELCMAEGDRDFTGRLKQIEAIVHELSVPVIIKEVGFGISPMVARQLMAIGVKYIDTAGSGGTNFIKIEGARNPSFDYHELEDFGIPTALSLLECRRLSRDVTLIASGGVRTVAHISKALVLGADMTGISGPLLRILIEEGPLALEDHLKNLIEKSQMLLFLSGASNLKMAHELSYKLTGKLKELAGDQ